MPKTDAHIDPIPIDDSNYLISRGERWYLRMNLPGSKQFVKALKIPSTEGKKRDTDAIRKAMAIIAETEERLSLDLEPNAMTMASLAAEFRKLGEQGVEINKKAGKPIARLPAVPGKNSGAWSPTAYNQVERTIDDVLAPFFFKGRLGKKKINQITQMDINEWVAWRLDKFPNHSPSYYKHQNTTLRHIFRLAQSKGERFIPPVIPDPPANLRERRRPQVEDDQYFKILTYLRGKYDRRDDYGGRIWKYREKFAYLHYQYIETINHTGCRPWNSPANAIKMADIDWSQEDGKDVIIIERREKGKTYYSPASRYMKYVLQRLERFYEREGVPADREFLFVHFTNVPGNNIIKGQPIKNFKKSWQKMMDHYKWNEGKKDQSERVTKYGLRHRTITRHLLEDKWTMKELAEYHGTSLQMVDAIYTHLKVKANYSRIMAEDYEAQRWVEVFDKKNVLWRQVERNSILHNEIYQEYPLSVEPPDEDVEPLPNDATYERWERGTGNRG